MINELERESMAKFIKCVIKGDEHTETITVSSGVTPNDVIGFITEHYDINGIPYEDINFIDMDRNGWQVDFWYTVAIDDVPLFTFSGDLYYGTPRSLYLP